MGEALFEKLGGRKFVLTIAVLVIGGLVEALGKNGLSQNFVALLLGSSTIFGVANAAITMKASGQVDVAGGAEVPVAIDTQLIVSLDEAHQKTNLLAARVEQQQEELQIQAEGLATATQLLKSMLRVNS